MVRALTVFRIYMIIGYVLSLILVGWILIKIVFPMIGRWIVDLCKKLEDANKEMEQERKSVLDQQVQRRKDDNFYLDMNENDIKSAYERNGFPISIKQKLDEEALFLDQCKKRKDGKINIGGTR